MEVRAIHRHARISPFKTREITRAIQGLPAGEAIDVLNFTPRKAAILVGRTLKSAIANAENNYNLDPARLVIKEAVVGEGPTLSRIMPRARGSASPIRKRSSHITIIVTDEIEIPAISRKEAREARKVELRAKQAARTAKKAAKPADATAPAGHAQA